MVWTTNNGIHFFRRPSQLHPSLFLSSLYSSSFARSRVASRYVHSCTQIVFQILFFMAVLIPLGNTQGSSGNSDGFFTLRVDPREWNIHIDEKVGTKIATIKVQGLAKGNKVNFALENERDYQNIGAAVSSHNWSKYFKITRKANGDGVIRLKQSLNNVFKPGQKVTIAVTGVQEGAGSLAFRHRFQVFVTFEPPADEEYEPEDTTTLFDNPTTSKTLQSDNTTNQTIVSPKPVTTQTKDSNASLYAGVVICIIIVIVIALMTYLSRKKIRPWIATILDRMPWMATIFDRDKDGARTENANGEFGFPSNAHELQKSSSTSTSILTLSISGGPAERKVSSSSIGGNSYGSNPANTTALTILDETVLEEDSKWEFPRHRLRQSVTMLGEGGFGQVWKFEADNIDGAKGSTTVAVKMLKANAAESEKRDLLQELAIMKLLDPHPNVVRLLGCCTEKQPIYVILEYVSGGTLQKILQRSRSEHNYRNLHGESQSLSSRDLTSFAYQIAKGMAYLSSKRVIHRDLAARNILVDTRGNNSFSAVDQWKCKVADFGFARDIMANNMYERKTDGKLPIRWMAPETIQDNIYTAKSDVWSFGVLMWEVVTLGSTPYAGMNAKDVIKYVNEGKRLEMPKHCKREIYNIMFYCWNADPSKRPEWSGPDSLIADFEKLLCQEKDYIDLNMYPEHEYYNEVDLSGEKI